MHQRTHVDEKHIDELHVGNLLLKVSSQQIPTKSHRREILMESSHCTPENSALSRKLMNASFMQESPQKGVFAHKIGQNTGPCTLRKLYEHFS